MFMNRGIKLPSLTLRSHTTFVSRRSLRNKGRAVACCRTGSRKPLEGMYMLSKGPYKIIAKSRRGLTKKLDTLENPSTSSRDIGKRPGDLSVTADMSSPKPIFHQVNGRRTHSQKSHQETITPQHEEIIRYIQDTWKGIYKEYETTKQSNDGKVPNVVYYQDGSSNQHLSNFQPFDLELFWGERLLQNIQQST